MQPTKGSPLNPVGQLHTGLSSPDLSLPCLHLALVPQGLGLQRSSIVNTRHKINGSPVNPEIRIKSDVLAKLIWQQPITSWTRADRLMIFHFTVGALTTNIWVRIYARISALKFDARLVV